MITRRFYINTMGCQMNVYDSSRMAEALSLQGYAPTGTYRDADLVIVNTCTIRDKARQKAVSFIGRLAREKQKKPDMIIAVGGCVAQQEGESLLSKFPQIDIVFGTHTVARLPGHVRTLADSPTGERDRLVDVAMTATISEKDCPPERTSKKISEFVTIMRGCDNYCTYCVVPYVRGRETSRAPESIVSEIRNLVAGGVREVTLLGQNVNSYGNREGHCSFPELLARVDQIEGLARLRFTTSHPKDLSRELILAFRMLDKLCSHFHLPVQTGADKILKRMNRRYTRQTYLEKLSRLRQARPDMAVTTDLIVGFPGETEADFKQTLTLLEEARFDNVFAFIYSDRSPAPAANLADKIPKEEKDRRLKILLDRQEQISAEKNSRLTGTTQAVLVEGPSKRPGLTTSDEPYPERQWSGRTTTNKVVNFRLPQKFLQSRTALPGSLAMVEIDNGFAHSLSGRVVSIDNQADRKKGETNAA